MGDHTSPCVLTLYIRSYSLMIFEWDSRKSEQNLRVRGFDFGFAALIFDSITLEREDDRDDYGEMRTIAIGQAEEVVLTVVYTDRLSARGEIVRRIISARRSNRRERQLYQEETEP